MVDYYDLVLGAIPTALLGITAAMTTSGFGLTTAVPTASAVVLGVMYHAMFVRTPGTTPSVESAPDSPGTESARNAGVAPPNAD